MCLLLRLLFSLRRRLATDMPREDIDLMQCRRKTGNARCADLMLTHEEEEMKFTNALIEDLLALEEYVATLVADAD